MLVDQAFHQARRSFVCSCEFVCHCLKCGALIHTTQCRVSVRCNTHFVLLVQNMEMVQAYVDCIVSESCTGPVVHGAENESGLARDN